MKRSAAFTAAALAALVVAASALAGGAMMNGYGGQSGQILGKVAGKTTKPGSTVVPGTLPFTGLDLTLFVGAAVLLVVAGLALRRTSRGQS